MRARTILLAAPLTIVLLVSAAARIAALGQQPATQDRSGFTVVTVKPNFYMIAGAGGNVAVNVGPNGVVITDTGSADKAEQLLAEIKRLTPQPIRYIINTNADADHVGGNATLSLAGVPILPAGYRRQTLVGRDYAPILAEERVLKRMSAPTGEKALYPVEAWPTSTYSVEAGETQRKLVINGDAIQVMYQPAAHTDGDSLVYFRRSDVLMTGDIFDATRFPVIDLEKGGSIQGVLDSLNRILEMTFSSTPFPFQEDGTLIVPGHGRLCATVDVVDYRDMVSIIRDRVETLIKEGKTLAEIQQADPTKGYRRQYGSDSGPWTTSMFVEAIYRGLTARQGATR
jgi:glyoxylase-like metal-dependent hydrolase (beta-lactamase superfamily II)